MNKENIPPYPEDTDYKDWGDWNSSYTIDFDNILIIYMGIIAIIIVLFILGIVLL